MFEVVWTTEVYSICIVTNAFRHLHYTERSILYGLRFLKRLQRQKCPPLNAQGEAPELTRTYMLLFFLLVRFGVFFLVHLEVDPAVPSAFATTAAPSASLCAFWRIIKYSIMNTWSRIFDH
ncbi:hypothetical protein F2Q69_00055575 [Brassica cretica]|uniref:Uncharacterized protein n=1 Tax=Brassica cretica TaxID=69181 RepID=A0A8S9N4J4_BRACR|nr:hypothetical protein F2Q69_00055575 [Brassica cretica]